MNKILKRYIRICFLMLALTLFLCQEPLLADSITAETGTVASVPEETQNPEALPSTVEDEFGEFDEFDEFAEFEVGVEDDSVDIFDPLGGYNRIMTVVNDRLYFWVLKPVARGYGLVLPRPVRLGINNVFANLGYPARFVNNVLQLKIKKSGLETIRFLVNSTVGVAGVWDPALVWLDLPAHREDFGQTLGHYGLGSGFHLVLPLLGPSNLRDSCGTIVDVFLSPTYYIEEVEVALAVSALDEINGVSLRLGEYEALTGDALDLYILLRDVYEQNRNKKIEE